MSVNNINQTVDLEIIWGVKSGMTRVFDGKGNHIPVTVIKLIPNFVCQVKTPEKDGYGAYQIAYGKKRAKLLTKPIKGHLSKASLPDACFTKFAEVRIGDLVTSENLGKELSIGSFSPNSYVDITSISKGKGFQGVIKRYHFSGGPASHGSHFHRHPGAIGNRATPARVFKEKKMPGRMGCRKVTIQNQQIVEVNLDKGYILIKGVVPGHKNSFIRIKRAIKKKG